MVGGIGPALAGVTVGCKDSKDGAVSCWKDSLSLRTVSWSISAATLDVLYAAWRTILLNTP